MPKKKGHDNQNLPDTSNLSEEQIEALITKLNEVPQILAALEAHQEARSKDSKSVTSKDHSAGKKKSRQQPAPAPAPPPKKEEVEEDDDDEDYDDFDEDADYPCVGDGFSDEVSVMSDMTTPTVVSSLQVDDEEKYTELLHGYGNQAVKKKKDLLGGVAAKGNASAASRKGSSNMSKGSKGSKKAGSGGSTTGSKTKKKAAPKTTKKKATAAAAPPPKKDTGFSSEWDTSFDAGGPGWTDFGATAPGANKKKAEPVLIDDDGFLVSQSAAATSGAAADPFGTTFGAFPMSSSGGAAAAAIATTNDFGGGGFGAFDDAFKTSSRPVTNNSIQQSSNFGLNGSAHSNSKFPSLPPPGTKKAKRTGSAKVGKSKTTENSINTKPKTSATTRKKVRRASLA